jgi:hypothetical protein
VNSLSFFIAGVIQGSSQNRDLMDQGYRQQISRLLKRTFPDARVISPYDLHPDSINYDSTKGKATFLEMVRRATECDVLVAYLPEASLGTAIEMWESYRNGVIVWTISPMRANWVVQFFSHRVFSSLEEFEKYLIGEAPEETFHAVRRRGQRPEGISHRSGHEI